MGFEVVVLSFTLLLTTFPMISEASPFMSLKHLEGCRKGDNVQGVQLLKNYLQRFGYLNYADTQSHRADNDVFDDQLESALTTYQRFYNLETTGTLDAKTIAQMSMPRCGVPDISHEKHEHKNGVHFHTVSHYSFFPGNPRWPQNKYSLTYAFSQTVPTGAKNPVRRAFNTWAANSKFRFREVANYNSADLKISVERGYHGDNAPFDGPPVPGRSNTIAHAYAPQVGLFHFDGDDKFAEGNTVSGASDWETVAVHEIGHLLGLNHSNVRDAVMYAYIPPQYINRNLKQDDVNGIRALYP